MSVLVLGESGQLARHLRRLLPDASFCGRSKLDISDTDRLERSILEISPRVVVNAAAYTAVDKAESEPAVAWRLNAEAPAAAARAAEILGIPLIHFSTDYVFDGESESEYAPASSTHPLSVYGRSKLGGELAVQSLCSRHWILRTSWVFSEFEPNFVRTMLRLGQDRPSLRIVDDQYGRPTHAGALAAMTDALLRSLEGDGRLPWGTWHAVGGDIVSWYRFAAEIFSRARNAGLMASMPVLEPITTAEYPLPAKRPHRAVLEPSGALAAMAGPAIDWKTGLDETLAALAKRVETRRT